MATLTKDKKAKDQRTDQQKKADEKHEKALKDAVKNHEKAVGEFEKKIGSDEGHGAELAKVQESALELQEIASETPELVTPTGVNSGSTGAAGTVVIGRKENAAILAAGGEVVDEKFSGSASVHEYHPTPLEGVEPPPEEEGEAEGDKSKTTAKTENKEKESEHKSRVS